MGNAEAKETDKSYHAPETIKLDYCAAVLAVVLKNHPKANDLYANIKDCMLLTGVQETFNMVEHKIPGSDELIKEMAIKAGYNKKSKPDKNSAIAARKLINGTMKLIIELKSRLYIWIVINNRRRRDLKVLARSVDTFIRVCFNRESDRAKGVCRVTGNSSATLTNLVLVRAMLETNEKYHRIYERMGKIPMFKKGKKIFDVNTVLDGKMPALAQRSLIRQYREAGFKLKHTKIIELTAWRWYQCRVVNAGPTEYYLKQLKQTTPEDRALVEPENLSHEIKEFDEALGYAREKTGKLNT